MKKILFVTQQLDCGGVEKALINFLNLIDRSKYNVELLVLDAGGEFRRFFPKWLTIHEYQCPEHVRIMTKYYRKPIIISSDTIKEKLSKLCWSFVHYLNKFSAKVFKKNISYFFIFNRYKRRNQYSDYDMIVDFHGYGVYTTYLTAHLQTRAKKVSWVHEETIYSTYHYIKKCYSKFDHIFGVSQDVCKNFANTFEKCRGKVSVLYNYLNIQEVKNKSMVETEEYFCNEKFKIVSVGRVSEQKSFIRVVEAARILKDLKVTFQWIVVGNGEELEKLKDKSEKMGVDDCVRFVGFKTNPYVFMKEADLYVQTSRAEGFCTTISEAVILGKAVVTTCVSGAKEQLDGGRGGIITEHSSEAIAYAIKELIDCPDKLKEKSLYNRNKAMDYEKEVEKLYKILE